MRMPLSSAQTTGARCMAWAICLFSGCSTCAASWVKASTLVCESATPKVSSMTSHVRASGTNCCWLRLTQTALRRAPYCTGALISTGKMPTYTARQAGFEHSERIAWCSVTWARKVGSSKTCLRSTTL